MVRLLGEISSGGEYTHSLYLTPTALRESRRSRDGSWGQRHLAGQPAAAAMSKMLDESALGAIGESDTGAALFWGGVGGMAVAPPFPLLADEAFDRMEAGPLLAVLASRPTVGVVLLRLGRYAVAVLEGEEVVVSKTGSRYVKARHRAGGSSQRRYERSRERLVHELYEAACSVVEGVFVSAGLTLRRGRESSMKSGPDYVLLGGEKHTLAEFVKRCPLLQGFGERLLARRLAVDRPGNDALEGIAGEVWSSRLVVFERKSVV